MTWVKWSWGNERWDGCGAPWDHNVVRGWGKGVEGRRRGRLHQPSSPGIAGPFPGPWRPVLGGRGIPRGWCLALVFIGPSVVFIGPSVVFIGPLVGFIGLRVVFIGPSVVFIGPQWFSLVPQWFSLVPHWFSFVPQLFSLVRQWFSLVSGWFSLALGGFHWSLSGFHWSLSGFHLSLSGFRWSVNGFHWSPGGFRWSLSGFHWPSVVFIGPSVVLVGPSLFIIGPSVVFIGPSVVFIGPWCPLCNSREGTTVHKRLVQCPKWAPTFGQVWPQLWGPWVEYAEQWYGNAPPEDLHHAACLRIPQSFYDQLPDGYGSHFREHVAHHQYMMLHKVYQLRRELMPPRDQAQTQPSQSASAWYGKIKPRVCTQTLAHKHCNSRYCTNHISSSAQKSRNLSRQHILAPRSTKGSCRVKIHIISR